MEKPKLDVAYKIRLGDSFTNPANPKKYHTLRYGFKPGSLNSPQNGTLRIAAKNNISLLFQAQNNYFVGSYESDQQQCILIFDPTTNSFVLERVTGSISVNKEDVNKANMSREEIIPPITRAPSQHATPSRRAPPSESIESHRPAPAPAPTSAFKLPETIASHEQQQPRQHTPPKSNPYSSFPSPAPLASANSTFAALGIPETMTGKKAPETNYDSDEDASAFFEEEIAREQDSQPMPLGGGGMERPLYQQQQQLPQPIQQQPETLAKIADKMDTSGSGSDSDSSSSSDSDDSDDSGSSDSSDDSDSDSD